MDDTTIQQAVKMYLSKPNLGILTYSNPKYWNITRITNMYDLFFNAFSFDQDISG